MRLALTCAALVLSAAACVPEPDAPERQGAGDGTETAAADQRGDWQNEAAVGEATPVGGAYDSLLFPREGAPPARTVALNPESPGATPTRLAPVDAAAVLQAMAGSDVAEIEAAQMALRRSQSGQVRAVATRLLEDHTRHLEQVEAATRALGLIVAPPERGGGAMVGPLEAAAGPEFDRLYLEQQAGAHEKAIAQLRSAGGAIREPALRSLVEQTLPALEAHLNAVRSALRAAGA